MKMAIEMEKENVEVLKGMLEELWEIDFIKLNSDEFSNILHSLNNAKYVIPNPIKDKKGW